MLRYWAFIGRISQLPWACLKFIDEGHYVGRSKLHIFLHYSSFDLRRKHGIGSMGEPIVSIHTDDFSETYSVSIMTTLSPDATHSVVADL